MGLASLRKENEGELTAGELFVAVHLFDEACGSKAFGENERELEAT